MRSRDGRTSLELAGMAHGSGWGRDRTGLGVDRWYPDLRKMARRPLGAMVVIGGVKLWVV